MDAYKFYGPPQSWRPNHWQLLQQLLERHRQIDIELTADLPPLDHRYYDDVMNGMIEELRLRLTEQFGPGVTVEHLTKTGGVMAKVGLRIARS